MNGRKTTMKDSESAKNEAPVEHKTEDTSSEEESSDDESLGLEGVLVRNSDASSSSSDEDEEDQKPKSKPQNNKRALDTKQKPAKRKKKEPDTLQVDFIFCDMNERYFHGLKSLLHSSSTVYCRDSSALTDLMIDNISVGTVVSTEGDDENVFGFASVLNVTTYQESPSIQYLKNFCLQHCPADRKQEMDVVLSGKTKRPAGFLLHSRMVNLPLEITLVLHQQLVLDMDWAVDHAEGGPDERKSLDFGVLIRLAPCQQEGSSIVYKFFDDEIFAGRADLVFTADAPPSYSKEEKQLVSVMVLTKDGHREAMKDFAKIVNG
jgi:protein BCP1